MDEETPPADVSVDIPDRSCQSRRRVLYRVPVQLRENKKHIYDPVVLPLGPYHHGREPHFELAEQLKNEVRDIVCSGANDKGFLLSKILERIDDQVRHFYGGANDYQDKELAEMMLRDACFVLCYIEEDENFGLICRRMGMSGALFMYRDMNMVENQIPLWLINMLISLIYQGEPAQSLLCNFLSNGAFGDHRMTQLPWVNGEEEEEEPLHLLEAMHRTFLCFSKTEESSQILRLMNYYSQPRANSPFRSVTDLKAKGIDFRRSSHCLTDIKFSSLAFYAQLHLPFFCVTNNSIVFLSNIIAFEMSPETAAADYGVTSYVNFMKTLIHKANDVRLLREKGILYSTLASDEDVVGVFKSIDTFGFCNRGLFHEIKMRINDHCNNRAKTWMADLINTNFQSPWTIIALLAAAAAFLLCLTFLQTYFEINPRITAT